MTEYSRPLIVLRRSKSDPATTLITHVDKEAEIMLLLFVLVQIGT